MSDRRLARNPIAIVGMSGLFPMARNHREYWQNIVDGTDCTEEVPLSRWNPDDYYDADPDAPDKTYSRRGAFLSDVEFDPLEFGLPPQQIEVTSTMQVLSLGVARDLLKDAGATGSDWYDPARTGVVLGTTGPVPLVHPLSARLSTPVLKEVVRSCGLSAQDADDIADKYVKAYAPWQENAFPGLLANVISGRVANRLGLGGMNCTVDAACAASLSAIRLAVAELVDGRAEMMITGGVDTDSSVFMYMCFSKVGALSRSGTISPFSDAADGTLLGEGIGMVALKRLADAVRDGNRIYAVIRGIGSSSDGRAKSIYAPRAEGQRVALERAYADADCSPASVELFEAHATGTVVGDRTELSALGDLLRDASKERHFAALGSVKSQIGHTKAAAGTAGLMKVALALHHKVLPGTIHVDEPNSSVDFTDAPFYVNGKTRPWIRDPHRPVRRAGVSAMGFGGTNFHLVLEEHESEEHGSGEHGSWEKGSGQHGPRQPVRRTPHRTATAYLWHAPDADRLLDLLRAGQPPSDGDAVPADHARLGFAAGDEESAEALRELAVRQLADDKDAEEWSHPRGVFFRRRAMEDLRVGALFAGQGSQYLDMGLEAVLNNPVVAGAFDDANAFTAGADVRLARAVFPPPVFAAELRQGQEATLRRTEYAQPAIGALSVGQFRCLTELGLSCSAFAGHSFGELTALWAAGALSDADYFTLAVARGRAMAPAPDADAGTMAAVQATRERVEAVLADHPDVVVCNHNAPEQVVIGGGTEQVGRALEAFGEQHIKTQPLPVAAAFHTRHVAHAVEEFRPAVEAARIELRDAPVYANSPWAAYGTDADANASTLLRQLLEPVEFVAALKAMRADGVTVFVEFGPKRVLTQFVRQTLGADVRAIATDAGPLGDSDLALKKAAVQLAVLGAPLSRINRHALPAAEPAPAGRMTVPLSGAQYVSPERQDDYRSALDDGRRVGPAAVEQVTSDRAAAIAAPLVAVEDFVHSPVEQHLALHGRYLENQLQVATEVAGALKQPMDAGRSEALDAIARQSAAIGQAHSRATEVLATLAELEAGLPTDVQPSAQTAAPASTYVSSPSLFASPSPDPVLAPAPDLVLAPALDPDPVSAPVLAPAPAPAPTTPAPPPESAQSTDVQAVLIEVIAQKTGYPVGMVDPTMDLEMELGVDSIKRVQVLAALQTRLPGLPAVEPRQMGELRTVDQIAAHLNGVEAGGAAPKAPEAAAGTPRHVVELVGLPAVDVIERPYPAEPVAVLLGDLDADGEALAAELSARGWTVHRAELRSGGADFEARPDARVDLRVLFLDARDDWDAMRSLLVDTVMAAGRAASARPPEGARAGFVTVTRLDGGLGLHGRRGPVASLAGGVGGVVKTLGEEQPGLFCRALDIDPGLPREDFVTAVLAEIRDAAVDTREVGVDAAGGRWTVAPDGYRPARDVSDVDTRSAVVPVGLTDKDVLAVTGGARGVTAACVRALAEQTDARFVLICRTELTPEPDWASGLTDADALRPAAITALSAEGGRPGPREVRRAVALVLAQREIRRTLADLGDRCDYLAVDIADADAVRAKLAAYSGRITGLVHGAGALADALLPDKTPEQIERVLRPKLDGLRNVLAALDAPALRHLVLFTSVAGLLGNPGQADYAAANEALCRFAAGWKHDHPDAHVTAIDWTAWNGGMVTPELRELFHDRGVPLLDTAVGARALVEQFTAARSADLRVLIGENVPLGGRKPAPVPAFVAHRDITGLAADPVVRAHRIGDHPVLPATFGLGWLVNVVERGYGGDLYVVGATDFQVHKGIVFDGAGHGRHSVEVDAALPQGDLLHVRATVWGETGEGRRVPHYGVTLVLAPEPEAPPRIDLPRWTQEPRDALAVYETATMFHGPALQGMRTVVDRSPARLAVLCRLPDAEVAGGAYAGRSHSPVLADLLLQSACVLGQDLMGSPSLPLGIGRVEWFAPLPDDEPFLVIADQAAVSDSTVTVSAAAVDLAGDVLCRFSGITAVSTDDLAAKFRASTRHWLAEAPRLQETEIS